jgi:glycerol kinase
MILSLDQGTSSSRAIIFNKNKQIVATAQQEFTQIYPQNGWVEHNPQEIWLSQLTVAQQVLKNAGLIASDMQAIGITNQRETTILWNRLTAEPVYNAIVWQDRRTAHICENLRINGHEQHIKQTTGLVLDAYFSATKIAWILDNVTGARTLAEAGNLCFGTVDTWLLFKLTGGKEHKTDFSNASRTMLFDINNLCWDDKILNLLNIPKSILPKVCENTFNFGSTVPELLGASIKIAGMAGDQQAALFGQACFELGQAKNTYGTGCFMLMNTGQKVQHSAHGLISTIAWRIAGKTTYALEGSVFIAGAAIQWLRDGLQILQSAAQSAQLAKSLPDNGGVYLVPAFTGLAAPYWDMYARGTIFGLTRSSTSAHLVRAALESLAYQTKDVLIAMAKDAGTELKCLRADGGASANDFLMQWQSNVLNCDVQVPPMVETTALGAAYLAGLQVGFWDWNELKADFSHFQTYTPQTNLSTAEKGYYYWQKAVKRSLDWLE